MSIFNLNGPLAADDIRNHMGIDYSDEQMAAIMHGASPAVVIAGAGSGKTAVMAARVMHLVINHNIEPAAILGLTFTKLATGELQHRVRTALNKLPENHQRDFFRKRIERAAQSAGLNLSEDEIQIRVGESEFDDCVVSTYHSFAASIVQEYGNRIGLERESQVLTGPARVQLAARVLRNPVANIAELDGAFSGILKDLLALDDKMADFDIEVEDFERHLAKLQIDLDSRTRKPVAGIISALETAQKRVVLAELVNEFRQAKLLAGVIDYADMTRFALKLVREFDFVKAEIKSRYQAVLLDEYQDTSVSQRKLMQELFDDGRAITAVGDPLQCIYRFRGASPANIDEFIHHFSQQNAAEVATYRMSYTQRNGKNIVALANQVASPLREYHPLVSALNPVVPARNGDGSVAVAVAADFKAEMDWLADQIENEIAAGRSPEEIAIILRRNADVMEVHRQLTDRGLNCQVRSKWALLEVPEVAEVISILRILAEPAANPDWIRILTGPRWRIGDRDLKLIADRANQLARGLTPKISGESKLDSALASATAETDAVSVAAYGDAIADIAASGSSEISAEAVGRLKSLNKEVEYLRQFTADGINDLVSKVIRVTGLGVEANSSSERMARGFASNLRSLQNLVSSFNTLGTAGTLFDFLDWIDAGEQFDATPDLPLVVHKGAIQLMTIHASKGLEYPVVALPRLYKGAFPTNSNSEYWLSNKTEVPYELKDEPIQDEIRTFPIGADSLMGKDLEAYKEIVKEIDFLDERRMAYVAITRAKSRLLMSTSWVQPGESGFRELSPFMVEVIEKLTALNPEFTPEINAECPTEVDESEVKVFGEWPPQIREVSFAQTRKIADEILQALNEESEIGYDADALNEAETLLVAHWDKAIQSLQAEAELVAQDLVVELPAALSVSALQRLAADENEFLLQLLRPMPSQPSRAASIGTAFHEYLERRFQAINFKGLQTELEFEEDQMFSDDLVDESNLKPFIQNFEKSEWNELNPFAFEVDFSVRINSRIVYGRIDAVYEAPKDSEYDWYVVDWKTNLKQSADPLQLALYRQAWAQAMGVEVERVRAGFFYAASGETVWPDMQTLSAVEEKLS